MTLTIPEWIIVSVYVALLSTTIIAAVTDTRTVSQSMTRWGWNAHWFATMNGVFIGHWWLPLEWTGFQPLHIWPLAAIPVVLAGVVDALEAFANLQVPRILRWPGWWLAIGMISGAFLWGM